MVKIQMVERPTGLGRVGGRIHLDFLLTHREKIVENVKAEGNLCNSDHSMIEFKTIRGGGKESSRASEKQILTNFRNYWTGSPGSQS